MRSTDAFGPEDRVYADGEGGGEGYEHVFGDGVGDYDEEDVAEGCEELEGYGGGPGVEFAALDGPAY